MRKFLAKIIALFSIYSGVIGLVRWSKHIAEFGFSGSHSYYSIMIIVTGFIFLFLAIGGFKLLRNKASGYALVIIAYLFQVIYIYTAELLYDLSAGFSLWIYTIDSSFVEFSSEYGYFFAFDTNISAVKDVIGFNVFAIIIVLVLITGVKTTKNNIFKDNKRNYNDKNDRKQVIYSSREFIR